eukprot:COSAG02_NODE_167_length_31944_cov_19.552237_7_plen_419_part_00
MAATGAGSRARALTLNARRSSLTEMQRCSCCELLPRHHRRLFTVGTQLVEQTAAAATRSKTSEEEQTEPFLPLPADRVDPSRHGRAMGMQGSFEGLRNPKDPQAFSPFRIKHTVGADAESVRPQNGSHGGPDKEWPGVALAGDQQFQTPWCFIHTGLMVPGAGIGEHIHGNCEEIFFCLPDEEDGADGAEACQAEFIHNGKKAEVRGATCVPVRCGESHGIYNNSSKAFRFYNVNCCQPGQRYDCTNLEPEQYNTPGARYPRDSPPERIPIGRLDRSLLQDTAELSERSQAGGRPPIRPGGGQGTVYARELWGERDFRSCFRYLRQYALGPEATMGPYSRDQIEECFCVLKGTGVITVGNDKLVVRKGDVIFAGLGEARQIAGPADGGPSDREELVLWNLGVAMDHHVDEAADCSYRA